MRGGDKKKHVNVGVKIDWQWWQVLRVGHVLCTHTGLLPLWLSWPQRVFCFCLDARFHTGKHTLPPLHTLTLCKFSCRFPGWGTKVQRVDSPQALPALQALPASKCWFCLTLHPEGSAAVLRHFFNKVLGKDTPSCMWSQLLCISFLPWHTTHIWFSRSL